MDFGPDKTDAQLLLDYGVLDDDNPKVNHIAQVAPMMSVIAWYMVMTHGWHHAGAGQHHCPSYDVLTAADCTQMHCTQPQHTLLQINTAPQYNFGCDAS